MGGVSTSSVHGLATCQKQICPNSKETSVLAAPVEGGKAMYPLYSCTLQKTLSEHRVIFQRSLCP